MLRTKYLLIIITNLFLIVSCEEILEKPLDEKKVVLLAPRDHLVTTDSVQLFYWQEMEGALRYQLEIVSPDFNSIERLIEDTTISKLQFQKKLLPGKYQWRVKAKNESTISLQGNAWSLEIMH